VLAPVLPQVDVYQGAVHGGAVLLGLQQLHQPLCDELNSVDGTAPDEGDEWKRGKIYYFSRLTMIY
jgi:hypothetical protein